MTGIVMGHWCSVSAVFVPIVGVGGKVEVGRTAVSAVAASPVNCAGSVVEIGAGDGVFPWQAASYSKANPKAKLN
jgi:hypothetical protein